MEQEQPQSPHPPAALAAAGAVAADDGGAQTLGLVAYPTADSAPPADLQRKLSPADIAQRVRFGAVLEVSETPADPAAAPAVGCGTNPAAHIASHEESPHSLPALRPSGERNLLCDSAGPPVLPDVLFRGSGHALCGANGARSAQRDCGGSPTANQEGCAPSAGTRGTRLSGACGPDECACAPLDDCPEKSARISAEGPSPASRLPGKRSAQKARQCAQTALAGAFDLAAVIARPVIRISVVALRVHRILERVNECPISMQAEDAWRRVWDEVTGLRSDMLWLNDHAHFDGPVDGSTVQPSTPEIDVTDALKLKLGKRGRRITRLSPICHIKSQGSGSDQLWELESSGSPSPSKSKYHGSFELCVVLGLQISC